MRRLAILLTAGTLAAGASPAQAGAGQARAKPPKPGWVLVAAGSLEPSAAAASLARDLGVTPAHAQELINAAYR
ncbi:MAG TPA: hypothetical protein VMI13_07130 [Solirubrobacteraceae bacterium]|nr:hypothetical protein [Solirubrobacteraceae bacterium]